MKVLIVSNDNLIYRIVKEYLNKKGHQIERNGSTDVQEITSASAGYDFVILNGKISINRRVIENTSKRGRIIDLSLSKGVMKRYEGQITSLSIVVVPSKNGEEERFRFLLAKDISMPESENIIGDLFGMINLESFTSTEIDKIVSEILVKPYLMALLSRKIIDLDFEDPSGEYKLVQELARIVDNYNIDQIRDLMRNNPHTGTIVAKLEENIKRVWNELSNY